MKELDKETLEELRLSDIDPVISKRADEFAEREYMCGAEERDALSKGYYWGYKEAETELKLTWEDVNRLVQVVDATARGFWFMNKDRTVQELYETALKKFNEEKYGKDGK